MTNRKKSYLKIHIQHELAYEIISVSIIIILLGITFLTASNLLRFNWYTVIFLILTLGMIYLKWTNQLIILDDQLTVTYYKFWRPYKIEMQEITEVCFYKHKRHIEIKTKPDEKIQLFMRLKYKKKLLNYIMEHHSDVNCIFKNN